MWDSETNNIFYSIFLYIILFTMGSSSSNEVNNEVTTEVLNSIMFKHSTSCQSIMSSEQVLSVMGNGNRFNGVSMEQTMTFDQDCRSVNTMTSAIQAEMQNKIEQAVLANTDSTAIMTNSRNDIRTKIRNIVNTNVTSENMLSIMSRCIQTQKLQIVGSNNEFNDIKMSQLQTHFNNAANSTSTRIMTELKTNNLVDTRSEAKVEGLGTILNGLFNFLSAPMIILFLGLALVALLFIATQKKAIGTLMRRYHGNGNGNGNGNGRHRRGRRR
jgi:hypothetical protein